VTAHQLARASDQSVQERHRIQRSGPDLRRIQSIPAINVKPLGDRVLVQPLAEKEVKKGDIIIPDTAKEKPEEGTVIAVGTDKLGRQWQEDRVRRQVGDKVPSRLPQ
jgi:co-chaperonin GroES (HSP10)